MAPIVGDRILYERVAAPGIYVMQKQNGACCRTGARCPAGTRRRPDRCSEGRSVMTREVRHEQPGYRVRGAATVEPLLQRPDWRKERQRGVQDLASQLFTSWNQIVAWLKRIEAVRQAA